MTKTAILFTGSAYNIRFSIKSAMDNLFIPNNADVFIVTERRCLRRKTVAGAIPHIDDWESWRKKDEIQIRDLSQPLTDEEIQLIRDTLGDRLKGFYLFDEMRDYNAYVYEQRKKMMIAVNEFRKQNIQQGIKPPFGSDIDHLDNGNLRCVIDQFSHIKKAYEFMCEYENQNGFRYDYVMRMRMDLIVPEKISVEYYTLPHDKSYWYLMGSVLRDPFPYCEDFCWFSKRNIADQIYPRLDMMGLIVDRKYNTFYEPQNNEFRFCAETQLALLVYELNIPWINVKTYRSAQYTNGGDGYDYMNYNLRRGTINIEEEYQLACKCESDINEHLPTLRRYAEQCTHITELGTRYGNSTVAFMSVYPKKFITYDVTPNDRIEYLQMAAKDANLNFEFRNENVEQIEIEETDLLFIDTNHHAEQCEVELRLHSGKVRKFIIFHDTTVFWERGQGSELGFHGLKYAIEPFLENNKGVWEVAERFENNNGLLILKRNEI